MDRRLRAWAVGGCLLPAACGGSNGDADADGRGYLQQTRDEFLRDCQADGRTEAQCSASLECIEEELTFDEYVQLALDKAGGQPATRLDDALTKCAEALPPD